MRNLYITKYFIKFLAIFMLAAPAVFLTACGNGGTPPVDSTSTAGPSPASIQLLVSNQQLQTSTFASTDLTAIVLDGSGQAMQNQVVIFSKGTDPTAYFTNLSSITDSSGVATATLNMGSDVTNRVITATATAGGAVANSPITVSGTKIAISGNTSLAINATSTLTIIVKDAAGNAAPDVALTVTSANGNPITLTPSTGITDSTGQITVVVTASNAGTGTDTLTVTGAGASQFQVLTINSANFAFTAPVAVAPATDPEITVDTPTPVSIRWLNGGAPVVGSTVNFFTSRGTITASAITNASGIATASLSAPSTGSTIITASGVGGAPAATLNVVMVTKSACTIVAQANPGTVAVNTTGSTSKQSVISVVVRDAKNNLVKNALINFVINPDPSGGSLASSTATTDITGTASVNYIAGTSFTGPNDVRIDATVNAANGITIDTAPPVPPSTTVCSPTATATLTVASQALYVRLGTDNKVYSDTLVPTIYNKKYVALVTDAGGNPAPDGTEVRFALRPPVAPTVAYMKGIFQWDGTVWTQYIAPTSYITATCVTEDLNGNGTLEPGEDVNGNGRLDPLGVVTVNPSATTVSGFATADLRYAKEFAYWVQMDLEARAGTVGNDPPSVTTVLMPGASSDYNKVDTLPPGAVSPFGVSTVCTDTQ